ncbi:MAG TPA: hypothetical protein VK437_08195 [Steroidobacteraceae bacterium]|nr:hypothetical protein [Steroidobacteraceae bacterium]
MPPRLKLSLSIVAALAIVTATRGSTSRAQERHEIQLPAETAALRSADLPGYRLALDKCGLCHSADYINEQPPRMSLAQWTAEVTKMQRAFGAPLEADQIKLIAVYLASVYGDATSIPPAELPPGRTVPRE